MKFILDWKFISDSIKNTELTGVSKKKITFQSQNKSLAIEKSHLDLTSASKLQVKVCIGCEGVKQVSVRTHWLQRLQRNSVRL